MECRIWGCGELGVWVWADGRDMHARHFRIMHNARKALSHSVTPVIRNAACTGFAGDVSETDCGLSLDSNSVQMEERLQQERESAVQRETEWGCERDVLVTDRAHARASLDAARAQHKDALSQVCV